MINAEAWMKALLGRLRHAFGDRLLFAGLQGSYRRGEAKETSDIDVVIILDQVALPDLDDYRALVRTMPEGDKACGFFGGQAELAAWPAHDRFALVMDTRPYFGDLSSLAPPHKRADGVEGARIAAGNLYHYLVHSYLYADPSTRPEVLGAARKSLGFLLNALAYAKTGVFPTDRTSLLPLLGKRERDLLTTTGDGAVTGEEAARRFAELIDWTGQTLRELARDA